MLMQAERQDGTNGQGKWCGADCCEGDPSLPPCRLVFQSGCQALRVPSLVTSPRLPLISDLFWKFTVKRCRLLDRIKSPPPSPGRWLRARNFVSRCWLRLYVGRELSVSCLWPGRHPSPPASTSLLTPHSFSSHSHTQLLHRHENTQIVPGGENVAGEFFSSLLKLPANPAFLTRSLLVPSSSLIVPLIRLLQSTWRAFVKNNLQAAPRAWGSVSGVYLLSFQAVMVKWALQTASCVSCCWSWLVKTLYSLQ